MSRIVAGVCMITVSLRALYCVGDVDCRGAAAGLSVGGCVPHAARCGEMTPAPRPWLLSSSYPRVYQVIPGYTRVYQVIPTQPQHFPINEYHKMQFLLKVLPSRSRRQQTPRNEPAAGSRGTSFKLRNFSAELCICICSAA